MPQSEPLRIVRPARRKKIAHVNPPLQVPPLKRRHPFDPLLTESTNQLMKRIGTYWRWQDRLKNGIIDFLELLEGNIHAALRRVFRNDR